MCLLHYKSQRPLTSAFHGLSSSSFSRVELPVYNTSDYYAPWKWVENKHKFKHLVWRGISPTLKVKFCSPFLPKIMHLSPWKVGNGSQREASRITLASVRGEPSPGNSTQPQKENRTSPTSHTSTSSVLLNKHKQDTAV